MGFDIRLEDEHGQQLGEVGDPRNLLHRLLPPSADASFSCLRFIDPYGDTVFNQMQIETFLAELARVAATATTGPELDLLQKIRELAERCKSEPHLHIKFYGD